MGRCGVKKGFTFITEYLHIDENCPVGTKNDGEKGEDSCSQECLFRQEATRSYVQLGVALEQM